MLNARVRRAADRLLPNSLRRALDPFESAVHDQLSQFAAELPANALVLDAGAGECQHAPLFRRQRYVSLDNTLGDEDWDYSKLDFIGDLESIPFDHEAFDAVISVVVLEHTREPKRVVTEMGRVTRKSGRIFLVVPNQWEVHQAPNDFFRFTRHGVEYIMNAAGFRVERIQPVGGFGWLMARRSVNALTFFQGGVRWLVFIALAPFLGLILPLVLYWAARFDRPRGFTFGNF